MRLLVALFCAFVLMPGCLTSYYDRASWQDPGLGEALTLAAMDGWHVERRADGSVVAIRDTITVNAYPVGDASLEREGAKAWSDAKLLDEVASLYAKLGRHAPGAANITTDHLHAT